MDEFGNPQSFLTQQADGSVLCEANGGSGNSTIFALEDINGYFKKSPLAEGPAKLSLSEGLYQGKCLLYSLQYSLRLLLLLAELIASLHLLVHGKKCFRSVYAVYRWEHV